MSTLSISCLYPFRRVKVVDNRQLIDDELGTTIISEMEPDLRFVPRCGKCGAKASGIHSWHRRNLVDLSLGHAYNQVVLNYRKVHCPECDKIRVEKTDVTEPGGIRVTKRMARYIHDLCEDMTVAEVARHLNLDWKTVKNADQLFLEEKYGTTDYSNLKYIAFDEISIGRYHKYMTVAIDFETGRVLWMGEGRKIETLDEFFSEMPEETRENIQAVAMDMWQSYISAVKKWCPKADIVFDKFHIVSDFNDAIDEVRRAEQRDKALSEETQDTIKGSRYILLKNQENLEEDEESQLEKLLSLNENLSSVYILKDSLKEIWEELNHEAMEKALDDWCRTALETGLEPVKDFVARVWTHRQGILNYAHHPIHNSKLEGINNKIKVIKRDAYGYHDQRYFTLKVKQAFPGD